MASGQSAPRPHLIGKCSVILVQKRLDAHRGGASGGCGWRDTPSHGLKIMNLLGTFEIFSCSLGRQCVDGLNQICLKYGTPVTLCVLLAYIEATVAREGHNIRLKGRCDFTIYVRYINLVQTHLGNTLLCYFSFLKHTHTFAAFFTN